MKASGPTQPQRVAIVSVDEGFWSFQGSCESCNRR